MNQEEIIEELIRLGCEKYIINQPIDLDCEDVNFSISHKEKMKNIFKNARKKHKSAIKTDLC